MNRYALTTARGPTLELPPHPDACSLEDLKNRFQGETAPLAIDLFGGAGGLSLGLQQAGFKVILGADHNAYSAATHEAWFPGTSLCADLSQPEVLERIEDTLEGLDIALVAGGPPCQPFSSAGRSKIRSLVDQGVRPEHDGRRELSWAFLDVVARVQPRAVLFENVPDLASGESSVIFSRVVEDLEQLDYQVHARILASSAYGVPQHRRRLIIIGVRAGSSFRWPMHSDAVTTVRDAIDDLPVIEAGSSDAELPYSGPRSEFQHRMRQGVVAEDSGVIHEHVSRRIRDDDLEAFRLMNPRTRYSELPEYLRRYRHDIFDDKYKRLGWDELSRTITAHLSRDGYWYIHPEQHRTLTPREAARLQTFPDWFRFAGTTSHAYRQIGEAVPPMLGEALGRAIMNSFEESSKDAFLRTGDLGARLCEWLDSQCDDEMRAPWRRSGSLWLTLIGSLLQDRAREKRMKSGWPIIATRWPTPEDFVKDLSRKDLLSSLGKDELLPVLERVASTAQDAARGLTGVSGLSRKRIQLARTLAGEGVHLQPTAGSMRVAQRVLGEEPEESVAKGQLRLARVVGAEERGKTFAAVLEIADRFCRSVEPLCGECPIADRCSYAAELSIRQPVLSSTS